MAVLLVGRFFAVVLRWRTALEESIDDGAGVKQVWGETQRRVRFYLGERNRRAGTEIRPLGRMRERLPFGKIRMRCNWPW